MRLEARRAFRAIEMLQLAGHLPAELADPDPELQAQGRGETEAGLPIGEQEVVSPALRPASAA